MLEKILDIPAQEVVRWVNEEKADEGGHLDFYEAAGVEYLMSEDFDTKAYGIENPTDYMLVSYRAVLDIEPRIEENYWILQVEVTGDLGPQPLSDEPSFSARELTIGEFEDGFLSKSNARVAVKVFVEEAEGEAHFEKWLADMQSKHKS